LNFITYSIDQFEMLSQGLYILSLEYYMLIILPDELTTAEVSIMCLLSEGDNHGYGLNELIEYRGFRNWTDIAFSSIYAILNRLEKKKLVSRKSDKKESGKGPSRNIYTLSTKGHKLLLITIRNFISAPSIFSSRVNLGAAYSHLLDVDEAVNCLEHYTISLKEQLRLMNDTQKQQEPLHLGARIVFDRGRIMGEAELKWIKSVIKQLKESEVV